MFRRSSGREKAEQVDPEVGLDQRWRRAADREETAEKDADDAECRAWEKGVQSDSAFVGLEPHSEDDKREADHRDHHQSGTEWEQSFVDEPAGNDPGGQSRQRVGQGRPTIGSDVRRGTAEAVESRA